LKREVEQEVSAMLEEPCFEVAFGLPWTRDGFLKQACVAGHPGLRDMGVHLNLRTLQGGMLNGRIYR
jgi:hypothetical protein